MAFLGAFLSDATSSANLNWELLAVGVSNKCTWLLLDVLGGARGLINSAALLWTLSIANLFKRAVALLHGLIDSLLFESDLAGLLKVLLANLLLGRRELCDISVVALLNILVGTLKNGVLLKGLDGLLFFDTAKSSLGIIDTSAEVNADRKSVV